MIVRQAVAMYCRIPTPHAAGVEDRLAALGLSRESLAQQFPLSVLSAGTGIGPVGIKRFAGFVRKHGGLVYVD